MSCSKCKTELSTEDLGKKIICDLCKARLCQTCSGLRETEIRVMQLNRRTLKLKCDMCEVSISDSLKQLEENFTNKLEIIQNNFTTLLNSLKDGLHESLSQTKAEVVILRESNIELVNLLTNANCQISSPYPHAIGCQSSSSDMRNETKTTKSITSDRIIPNTLNLHRDVLPHSRSTSKSPNPSYAQTTKKLTRTNIINKNVTNQLTQQPINQLNSYNNEYNSQIANNLKNSMSGTTNQEVAEDNTQVNLVNTDAEYQVIKRRKKKTNIGSGKGDDKFHGKPENNKKIWLFVSRVPDDVGAEDIMNYIKTNTKTANSPELTHMESDVVVKLLNTNNTRPNNQSFMVGVEPEFQEVVYKSNFWPRKIGYERFDFRRGQRFLRNVHESPDSNQLSSFLDKAN